MLKGFQQLAEHSLPSGFAPVWLADNDGLEGSVYDASLTEPGII